MDPKTMRLAYGHDDLKSGRTDPDSEDNNTQIEGTGTSKQLRHTDNGATYRGSAASGIQHLKRGWRGYKIPHTWIEEKTRPNTVGHNEARTRAVLEPGVYPTILADRPRHISSQASENEPNQCQFNNQSLTISGKCDKYCCAIITSLDLQHVTYHSKPVTHE
ncbi:hypothetical protein J6590_017259 [Homalodisca vitripennis]|nr:hypothetical protein J6590_017259 [Homalodisca vitripennis]